MWNTGHPYRWRTWLRSNLPSFFVNWRIVEKGNDCEKVGGQHHWYNLDGKSSGCYHCKVIKEGKFWNETNHAM